MLTTKKRNSVSSENGIANLIEAFSAAHGASVEADQKARLEKQKAQLRLKTDIMKHYATKQIDSNMKQQELRAQQQTPEQQYLRRRAMQENPLMAMMGPQDDQSGGGTVTFDQSVEEARPTINQKTGLYQEKPLNAGQIEDNKGKAFMALLDRMTASGKTPPQWMVAAGEKIKARTNARLGYDNQESSSDPKGRTVSELRAYIKELEDLNNPDAGTPENDAEILRARKEYYKLMGRPQSTSESTPETQPGSEQSMQSPDADEGGTDNENDMEAQIANDMAHYGKTREEVILEYRKKGLLK